MDTTTTPAPRSAYPLARPRGDDRRLSLGLARDISDVLLAHGYPPIATGDDLLRWQNALFTTIYHPSHCDIGKENS